MSGFIWSALGGAVGNAGNAISGMMMRDIEDQRRLAEEDRKEANYIKRLEEADRIKSERDAKREEELQQRIIRDQAAARTRAGEIGRARDEERLNTDAARLAEASASIAGDAPSTTAEQFKEMLRKDPSLRDQFAKTGVVGRNMTAQEREFQEAKDLGEAAMAVGAHSSVINAYAKLRSDVLDKIKEENKERERKADREATNTRLAQNERRLDILDKNADSNRIRAERPPASRPDRSQEPIERLTTQAETLRKAAKEATGDRRAALQADLDDVLAELRRRRQPESAPAPGGAASAPGNNRASSGTTRNYSNLWN